MPWVLQSKRAAMGPRNCGVRLNLRGSLVRPIMRRVRLAPRAINCANLRDGGYVLLRGVIPPQDAMSFANSKPLPSTIVREDEGLLVSAAKAGDLSAFDELTNRYERRIFRLTMNITQNREDAEDATQDAFLKSFQHLNNFEGSSRFYTWLVRIAVNEALMRLRRRRPNVISIDKPVETEEDLVPREIEDWGPSPEQRYAVTELNSILNNAISGSSPSIERYLCCATSNSSRPKKRPKRWPFRFPP